MNQYRIKPNRTFRLKDFDPDDTGDYRKNDQDKARARAATVVLPFRGRNIFFIRRIDIHRDAQITECAFHERPHLLPWETSDACCQPGQGKAFNALGPDLFC